MSMTEKEELKNNIYVWCREEARPIKTRRRKRRKVWVRWRRKASWTEGKRRKQKVLLLWTEAVMGRRRRRKKEKLCLRIWNRRSRRGRKEILLPKRRKRKHDVCQRRRRRTKKSIWIWWLWKDRRERRRARPHFSVYGTRVCQRVRRVLVRGENLSGRIWKISKRRCVWGRWMKPLCVLPK